MKIRILFLLTALFSTTLSFAAVPRILYVSWIPGTSQLMAGSKPSVRITLSAVATSATQINLSAEGSDLNGSMPSTAISLPTSVLTIPGSRYVTFPVTLNGVDSNTTLQVKAANAGAGETTSSPSMTILAARLLRVTFNSSPINVLRYDVSTEVKFTLTGPAGPSGFVVNLAGCSSDDVGGYLYYQVTLDPGQVIFRGTVEVPDLGFSGSVNCTYVNRDDFVSTTFSYGP